MAAPEKNQLVAAPDDEVARVRPELSSGRGSEISVTVAAVVLLVTVIQIYSPLRLLLIRHILLLALICLVIISSPFWASVAVTVAITHPGCV